MYENFIVIDANNLAHGFSYTLAQLRNEDGLPTGIIYGLTRLLFSICKKQHPDALVFVFDPIPKELVPVEEGGKHPPEFYYQLLAIINLLDLLNVEYIVAAEGTIADYVLAGVVHKVKEVLPETIITIYSNDHDFFQLVDETITILKPGKQGDVIDLETLQKKYSGLDPRQLPELWALTGDVGDGILGVRGIGPVRGMALIQEHGSLTKVLTALEAAGKYIGASKDAWEAFALINLWDKKLPENYVLNPSCAHLYFGLNEQEEALKKFFSEFGFNKLLGSLIEGTLVS